LPLVVIGVGMASKDFIYGQFWVAGFDSQSCLQSLK
jgi:hypothetical protein